MSTYWVLTDNPPSNLIDAWEFLYEAFGTEPFSKELAVDTLVQEYPDLGRVLLGRVVDAFVDQGSLGISMTDF